MAAPGQLPGAAGKCLKLRLRLRQVLKTKTTPTPDVVDDMTSPILLHCKPHRSEAVARPLWPVLEDNYGGRPLLLFPTSHPPVSLVQKWSAVEGVGKIPPTVLLLL